MERKKIFLKKKYKLHHLLTCKQRCVFVWSLPVALVGPMYHNLLQMQTVCQHCPRSWTSRKGCCSSVLWSIGFLRSAYSRTCYPYVLDKGVKQVTWQWSPSEEDILILWLPTSNWITILTSSMSCLIRSGMLHLNSATTSLFIMVMENHLHTPGTKSLILILTLLPKLSATKWDILTWTLFFPLPFLTFIIKNWTEKKFKKRSKEKSRAYITYKLVNKLSNWEANLLLRIELCSPKTHTSKFQPTAPQNVTLYGNRVIVEVIS